MLFSTMKLVIKIKDSLDTFKYIMFDLNKTFEVPNKIK